jgi:hypothetical protein
MAGNGVSRHGEPAPILGGTEPVPESAQDDKWSCCLTAGTLCPATQEIHFIADVDVHIVFGAHGSPLSTTGCCMST